MVKELELRLLPEQAADAAALRRCVAGVLGTDASRLRGERIVRRSIDARQRQVMVNITVRVWVDEEMAEALFEPVRYPDVHGRPKVVVVGAGPAGLFAALRLIELGLCPVVVERGKDVHARKVDLARISREHHVDADSNYSFGEGGAGAYSDGKLYTRSKKRGSVDKVLRIFCQHGASPSILVDAHPHIGTDRLPGVIERMRATIIDSGGEVHFCTRMTDLLIEDNRVVGIEVENCDDASRPSSTLHASSVVLATGHSARDVYRMLARHGLCIEAKGIAVGVRLEHPSHLIDQIQYHSREGRGRWLPAAEYSYVHQVRDRGVYSFCMCPGGVVVPAATGEQQVVVNGMSPSHRGGRWSNSGMVVELRTDDLAEPSLAALVSQAEEPETPALAMMALQEVLERHCWLQGGRCQTAPAQRMTDFCSSRLSADLSASSYAPGLVASPLHFWMPSFVGARLQEAFRIFGRKAHGFLTSEATVIGVETRTSAPVRMVRNRETFQLEGVEGLYPCGEGAGYAGGIVSAAIDGMAVADAVFSSLQEPAR